MGYHHLRFAELHRRKAEFLAQAAAAATTAAARRRLARDAAAAEGFRMNAAVV